MIWERHFHEGIALCPVFQYVQRAYSLYIYFHNADNFYLKQNKTKNPKNNSSPFKVRSCHDGEKNPVDVVLLRMMLE